MSKDLLEQAKLAAKKSETTLSGLIRNLLLTYIKEQNK